jgi:hypothetical protein
MGDKYAGPEEAYGAIDAENQNNALAMGADNSINDPNWQKRKLKKGMRMSKPAKMANKTPKIDVRKGYSEGY